MTPYAVMYGDGKLADHSVHFYQCKESLYMSTPGTIGMTLGIDRQW